MATAPAASGVRERAYLPEDDEGCKELERRAMQGGRFPALQRLVSTLFRLHFVHNTTFDGKARQFDDCIVRVAEDRAAGGVIGCVCVGIKNVIIGSRPTRIGLVYDLRVDERAQGKGIGRLLSESAERLAAERGVQLLYLTVNSDNTKAKRLYKSLGWTPASQRKPALQLLHQRQREDPALEHSMLAAPDGLRVTQQALAGLDFILSDLSQLFNAEWYEGTLYIRTKDSSAGVSMWNGSGISSFHVERVLLPTSWWGHPLAQILVAAAGASVAWWWARRTAAAASAAQWATVGGMSVAALAAGAAAWYLVPVLSHVRRVLRASDPPKLRARLFAPFATGPAGKDLLTEVVRRAHNAARERGYAMTLCNLDRNSSLAACFPSSKFRTEFMQKPLPPPATPPPPFPPDAFFDPRDI
eukprot:TRINITY_DN12220_c0_g1_i1.p1 TRINITY_DN12220_c0_g1~~TRINITY_DN12220_c0_g1_i1.p1  ORF type:complete len:438 (+),score=110.58 TRINITY_DN12220_c0_g1_i1:75-1316(+)